MWLTKSLDDYDYDYEYDWVFIIKKAMTSGKEMTHFGFDVNVCNNFTCPFFVCVSVWMKNNVQ